MYLFILIFILLLLIIFSGKKKIIKSGGNVPEKNNYPYWKSMIYDHNPSCMYI